MGVEAILGGFLPRIELKKFGSTPPGESVDEDVRATADREVTPDPLHHALMGLNSLQGK